MAGKIIDPTGRVASSDIASPDSPHHIRIAFVNDHDFNGARFDIQNVTPEQIAAAILRLQHVAFMMLGAQQQAVMQQQAQANAVREQLAREKGN